MFHSDSFAFVDLMQSRTDSNMAETHNSPRQSTRTVRRPGYLGMLYFFQVIHDSIIQKKILMWI